MTESDAVDAALARRVAAQWAGTAETLAALRRRELAALTDADGLAPADDLLQTLDMLPPLPPRPSSGLVEQQRLFAQLPPG